MPEAKPADMTETPAMPDPRDAILDAAAHHVAFDGWSDRTLNAAAREAGVDPTVARGLFPRGGVDLALAWHRRGDALMAERLRAEHPEDMRFRDRVARAVRLRIEAIEDREAARRGLALFALPHHAAEGTRALWDTADAIWTALGDSSEDVNWYTKRATLSGVYSATLLYWLGDDSLDHHDTWDFLDRRIEEVMQIEKAKAGIKSSPVLRTLFAGPLWAASLVRAPKARKAEMPGHWPIGTGRGLGTVALRPETGQTGPESES